MFYVRGNRADYDAWATDYSADGWSYEEVLPLFKRQEHNAELHDRYHGTNGELHVTQRRWISPHLAKFLDAAAGCGIERNPDYNGARQDGASTLQTTTKSG
jgi:choline dehydrogenase